MSLCIVFLLSIALLSHTQRFSGHCDAVQALLLLIASQLAGLVIIFANAFYRGKSKSNNFILGIFKAIISYTLSVPGILIICSVFSMLFCINHFAIVVAFQIGCSSVSDLSVSLMNNLTKIPISPKKK